MRHDNSLKLSIITVVFNAKNEIKETIESVIILKKRFLIEYIVIDGGSSDGTNKIIDEFASGIDKYVSERDAGIYDAMNKGIALASGRWILFMNAGDHMMPISNDLWSSLDEDFVLVSGNTIVYGQGRKDELIVGRRYDGSELGLGRYNLFHQSIFYRRDELHPFDTSYRIIADGVATWDIISRCGANRSVHVNVPVSRYLRGGVSENVLRMNMEDLRAIRKAWPRCNNRQRLYFSKRYCRDLMSVFLRSIFRHL